MRSTKGKYFRCVAAAIFIHGLFRLASPSFAAQYYADSIEAEIKAAKTIVRGSIQSIETKLAQSENGQIETVYTYYELEVSEVFKGSISNGSRVFLRSPGGKIGDTQAYVTGTAEFEKGEDTLVLLGPQVEGDGSYPIYGMRYGKFKTFIDSNGKNAFDGPMIGAVNQLQKERSQPGTGVTSAWTFDMLRETVNAQSKDKDSDNLPSAEHSPDDANVSASGLLNKSPQAQTVEGATRSDEDMSEGHEQSRRVIGDWEILSKMEVLLPWVIGFLILLIVPFFIYQLMRKG